MTFGAYRQIFRVRDFRLYWLGFTLSFLGDTMTRVALIWFVYERTKSADALGWLMLCYTGPIVVGGLLAGALLDRFERRRVILADSLVRGCAVALLPLLAWLGWLDLWHVYAVAAVYGLLMMISLAGGPALIPSLVPQERLATANALEMLSFTCGGIVGPTIAGLLIARVGAMNVVLLDACSYFAFALILSRLAPQAPAQAHGSTRPRYHLGHAVQLLITNPVLLATTVMFFVFNIGGGMLAVWLPILVDQRLGGASALYGLLLGARASGELLSALLAGGLILPLALGTRICLTQALAGVALGALLIGGHHAWAVAACLALFGLFSSPMTIWAQTLRMRIIPEALRGRTFALLRMLMQSGNPLGGAGAGLLLPLVGLTATMGLSTAFVALPAFIGYTIRALREAGPTPPTLEPTTEPTTTPPAVVIAGEEAQ